MENNQVSIQPYEREFRYTVYPHAYLRIIRPNLPAIAQLLYISLIDRMFGFHLPEGTPIKLSYRELRFQNGIRGDLSIRTNMIVLEIMGLVEHSKEGYTVNFAPLRMVETWMRSLPQEKVYEKYLRYAIKRTKKESTSKLSLEVSKLSLERSLNLVERCSKLSLEALVRLWGSNPSHRAQLRVFRNYLKLFLNKTLKPNGLKLEGLEFKFMNLDREERSAITSLCNQAMNDPETNFYQTDILALLEEKENE